MIVCRSATGERVIAAKDFFVDTFQTAIEPTEILTEIRFRRRPRAGWRLRQARAQGRRLRDGRRGRRHEMEGGSIGWAGIGITGASDSPYAAEDAAILAGNAPSDDPVPTRRRSGGRGARPAADVGDPSTTSGPWSPSSRSGTPLGGRARSRVS